MALYSWKCDGKEQLTSRLLQIPLILDFACCVIFDYAFLNGILVYILHVEALSY